MTLENTHYKTNELTFYTFLKWYEDYIEDLQYKKNFNSLLVTNTFEKEVAILLYGKNNQLEEAEYYVVKTYFDMMRDFDFNLVSPRKIRQIITEEENGKQKQVLKTTVIRRTNN